MSRHLWLLPAIAVALIAPSAARADSPTVTWSDPTTVVSNTSAAYPDLQSPLIASDAAGDLSALWLGGPNLTLQTATRAAGGHWSTPVELDAGYITDLSLAVSPDGHAVAGWILHPDDEVSAVRVATRMSSGAWTAPADIQPTVTTAGSPSQTDEYAIQPADGGTILSLWTREYTDTVHQNANGYEFVSDILGPDVPLPLPAAAATGLQLGVDAAGNATAVFMTADSDGHTDQVITAFKSSRGIWGAPTSLTGGSVGQQVWLRDPHLHVSPTGAAVVTWEQTDQLQTQIRVATQTAIQAQWSPPGSFATVASAAPLGDAAAIMNPDGTGLAAWSSDAGLQTAAFAAGKTSVKPTAPAIAGGVQTITTEVVDQARPQLVVDPGGVDVVVWMGYVAAHPSVRAVVRDTTGAWQSPATVLDGAENSGRSVPSYSATVDGSANVTLLATDGAKLQSATLSTAALDPPKPQPITVPQQSGGASHTVNPKAPVVGGGIASHPHVMVKLYLVPTGKGKCPVRAVATVGTVRTAVEVTKVRQSSGKIRCLASGAVPVPTTAKAGSKLSVLVSARGVAKRKLTFVVLV